MSQNLPDAATPEFPNVIYLRDEKVFEIARHAIAVGQAIHDLGWPRRKIVNRLQLRLEYYLDAGGVYKDHECEIFAIHEDSIDQTFGSDPDYKWLSAFPRRCNREPGWDYPSQERLWKRFQILDVALRTPPIGDAI